MTANAVLQLVVFLALPIAGAVPLGAYMARVYAGEAAWASRLFGPLERALYRVAGVSPNEEMSWKRYAAAVLLFNLFGALVVYALQRLQAVLPMNPGALPNVTPALAFKTAVSFATNTNWQAYSGETSLSQLTQMLGLAVQNFVSAGTGMAVLVAFVRGFTQPERAGSVASGSI